MSLRPCDLTLIRYLSDLIYLGSAQFTRFSMLAFLLPLNLPDILYSQCLFLGSSHHQHLYLLSGFDHLSPSQEEVFAYSTTVKIIYLFPIALTFSHTNYCLQSAFLSLACKLLGNRIFCLFCSFDVSYMQKQCLAHSVSKICDNK